LGISAWQYATLLLICCLVSGILGWATASARIMYLDGRVSEMEAAVSRYWDRVRKRMSIDIERPVAPKRPEQMTEQEIIAQAQLQGVRWPDVAR
jgi:hypothetical protein